MGAEIRYLLAASGATINDNREAINDATMTSATSGLVQEDPMPTRAGSYLAALLRDAQAPRTQAQSTATSLVNATASQERPAAPAHLALPHDLRNVGSEQALPLRRRRKLADGPRARTSAAGGDA